jgi:predicted nucleic acid-binding protein
MDAFDSDALIYAAIPGHALGRRVKALFSTVPSGELVGTGSLLLLPEVLAKPVREARFEQEDDLKALLARLELQPMSRATANLATAAAAKYSLQAADAIHLASALEAGADRFITNNQRDFPQSIEEVDVVYPADLPDPEEEPNPG